MSKQCSRPTNQWTNWDLSNGFKALQSKPGLHHPGDPFDGHEHTDHAALIYDNRDEQFAAVIPFIRQGLERGERCMYLATENSRDEICATLRDGGVDVDTALNAGQLSIHSAAETYLADGAVDIDTALTHFEDALETAAAEYEGLRVTAEETWLLGNESAQTDFMALESHINDLIDDTDFLGLCQYNRARLPPDLIEDVINTHPTLIYDGTVCQNVYYTPPDEYFGPARPARDNERKLETLVDRTEARTTLQTQTWFQHQLYDIVSQPDRSFDEKLQTVFDLGCDLFDMELGAMARVDPDTDRFEIERTSADHEYFEPGVELDLSETYCTAVTDGAETASVSDPKQDGYGDITVRKEFGLQSYLGTYITLSSDTDRTFFFVTSEQRDEPISDAERACHHLMGQWVEYELGRQQREQFLRELYETTADPQMSFAQKLERLLNLGRERFDLEIGYFTQTDDDMFEIVDAVGDHDHLEAGVRESLCDTYCEKLLASPGPISVTDAAKAGWTDGPAYERYGLDAYFATTVHVGGEEYGTLCFASVTPREEAYTDAERTFLDLMSQWISYELERRHRERYLRESYAITSDPDLSFEQKLKQLLDLGRERFGLAMAGLNHLPTWGGTFELEMAVGVEDSFPDTPVSREPDDGVFCHRTVTADGPVGMPDVRGTNWAADPIHTEHGLTSYLGTKVTSGSTPYGTLWFASTEPRDRPFSDAERTFIELMGQWVSYELERREHKHSQRALSEITADPDLATDEKLRRLLELGCERLDLSIGMVNRDCGEVLEIEQMHGTHSAIDEGACTPQASEHYCQQVVETGERVIVTDAAAAGWEDDPLYDDAGLETYAGLPVSVGGGTYGTLCFMETSPRQAAFTEPERAFLDLIGQCVGYELDRTRRERRLHALSATGRKLLDADTPTDVAEGVAAAAADAFDRPIATVALYDDDTGDLRPAAHTDAATDLLEATSLFDGTNGAAWDAFVSGDSKQVRDPLGDTGPSMHPPVSAAVVHPLGTHGVLLVGTSGLDGFQRGDQEAITAVAATVRTALDRVTREQQLQAREATLEDQNETLERLNRINDTIRRIDQALVEASTRGEIEHVVCEELAAVGPYELAWIGDHECATGAVRPREWAGTEKGYLDDVTITVDDSPEGCGPFGRAVKTGEPQVVNDILTDESFAPWRQDALNRGYHATAALPLTYDDTQYGVLSLYAGQPGVFDALERDVLAELAATIAHAINAVESKKALVSDRVTELEFTIADDNLAVVELVRELDCEFSMKRLVPQADGGVRGFFSVRGASAADVLAFESRLPVTDLRVVSNADDDAASVFEATLTDESLSGSVLNHGGRLRQIHVADGTASVIIQLAADAAVREFVEMFQSKYPESELHAQSTTELRHQTALEFATALTGDLTDRQLETLQTAYYSGYFEEPRTRTGTEIADTMDVSQPTFNSHVRAAMRKLCRCLFEDEIAVE